MFTGIVTDIGEVKDVSEGGTRRFTIATRYDAAGIAVGASIACAGACLTVTAKGGGESPWFAVEAAAETLRATTAAQWRAGTKLNLERALKIGDELGGHIVTGHVDGVGRLAARAAEGDAVRMDFSVPEGLARFIAPKGSIAVDGVSLTVNQVSDNPVNGAAFSVMIIPHTLAVTTLGALAPGDAVNLEADILARYVARLAGAEAPSA